MPSNTIAPRIANTDDRTLNYSRSSEVLGSFTRCDKETSMKYLVRKVTERCGTTQKLMYYIRKFRTAKFVTMLEFKLILGKFGVQLPQDHLVSFFQAFDTDRSNTIDFDEFSTWIMSSGYNLSKEKKKKNNGIRYARYDINGKIIRPPRSNVDNCTSKIQLPSVVATNSTEDQPIKLLRSSSSVNGPIMSFGSSPECADRRLRNILNQNKSFQILKTEVEKVDKSGAIIPDMLFAMINQYCAPFSSTDFRLVLTLWHTDDRKYIDWSHFISLYGSKK